MLKNGLEEVHPARARRRTMTTLGAATIALVVASSSFGGEGASVAPPADDGYLLIGRISLDLSQYQRGTGVYRSGLEVVVEGAGQVFRSKTDDEGYFHSANVPGGTYSVVSIEKPGAWTVEPGIKLPRGPSESRRLIDLGPLDMVASADGRLETSVTKAGALRGFVRRHDVQRWAQGLGAVNSILVSEAFAYDSAQVPASINDYEIAKARTQYARRTFASKDADNIAVIFTTHNLDRYNTNRVNYSCRVERDGDVIFPRTRYAPADYHWELPAGRYAPMRHDTGSGGCVLRRGGGGARRGLEHPGSYTITLYFQDSEVSSVRFRVEPGTGIQQTDASASRAHTAVGELARQEFEATCAPCHGLDGGGSGPAAEAMGLTLADLSDPARCRETTDAERFSILRVGIPGTAMQAFGAALSDAEVWELVAHLGTLCRPEEPKDDSRSRGMGGALPDPSTLASETARGLANGAIAPEMRHTDVRSGEAFALSDWTGPSASTPADVVVVGFAASWCSVCAEAYPFLEEMRRGLDGRLKVVLVTVDATPEGRRRHVEIVDQAGLEAPILEPSEDTLRVWLGQSRNVPHLYVINRAGEVLVQDRGFGDKVRRALPGQVEYALSHPDYVER